MSKKILSVVLALALVLTTFAVSAFAAGEIGYEDEDSTYYQSWALSEPKDNGNGVWTVDVSLEANYCVGAISFIVNNTNPTGAVLTKVEQGAGLVYTEDGEILPYETNIKFNPDTGYVAIILEATYEAQKGADLKAGGVVATLTYTLAEGATADIAIDNTPKTAENPGGDLIAVRMSDETLVRGTMIYGQTVTSVGETRTLGGAAQVADPELIAKDGTTGYVDAERMYVYGVDAGADPLNYFEATNNGYIEMSEGAASVTNGTGATLTLYRDSTKAEVISTYTLIIFGDVNGDGNILPGDSTLVLNHVSSAAPLSGAFLFAADVNADGNVLPGDSTIILNHVSSAAPISANVWAA